MGQSACPYPPSKPAAVAGVSEHLAGHRGHLSEKTATGERQPAPQRQTVLLLPLLKASSSLSGSSQNILFEDFEGMLVVFFLWNLQDK